ncbi:MAG: hypothetical protein PWR20_148 [Bacteroidales bacterium]|nr:hypothetical protein [Bacteroidales bacterium]MDN5328723.1 hypothetical protein [Bacteroidales bacterium]
MSRPIHQSRIMRQLLGYFVQGLLLIAPLSVTFWAIVTVVNFLDEAILSPLEAIIGFRVPGLGLLALIVLITITGFLGSTILFRPVLAYFDRVISKAPLIKIIYTAVKDFLQAFVGQQRRFTEPVLVRVDDVTEADRIGFVTSRDLSMLGLPEGRVAVYFPSSYTVLGELLIMPASRIRPLDIAPAEVMKYVISGGVTSIHSKQNVKQETKS